jgi:hypothetical protein
LFGADVPLVLRRAFIITGTERVCYQHIGTVYASNWMHGQALQYTERKGLTTEEFTLF